MAIAEWNEELTRREMIVQSVLEQIKAAFPEYKVERGFVGAEVSTFPSLYVFEGEESVEWYRTKRPGIYIKTLPIVVEYMKKTVRANEAYALGNRMLGEIAAAVEQDEYFVVADCDNKLVIEYKQISNMLVQLGDNVIDALVEYAFVYYDRHLGIPL